MKKETVRCIKWSFIIFTALTVLYFCSRLINLTIIPIFTDEAIYLRWGQIALTDPKWRFISLIDGKQPLLIWLFLPAFKIISDPLVAGRLVSIIAGFLGMIGMVVFGWYLTKNIKGAIISGLFYILSPFFLIYDRLAIYDSLLSAIGIWALFLSYLFGKKLRLDIALLLGTLIGLGLLTKSSAHFYWILLPITLLLIPWTKKKNISLFFKWLGLIIVIIIQSQIYANILRLSEFRHIVAQKNLSFIYSFSEFIKNPFGSLWGNLTGLTTWLVGYLSWPIIFLFIFAIYWLAKNNWKKAGFLFIYFLVPYLALASFGRVIYPRFILFMVPPLFLIITVYLNHLLENKNQQMKILFIILIIFIPLIYFDYKILFNPIYAPLPYADKQQLINDWPSGYGIKEVVAYLTEAAKNEKILVGTEGTFGLYPMALELYLGKNSNVTFKAYWPVNEMPKELVVAASNQPVFLLFKEKEEIPDNWPLSLIQKYQRGSGNTYLRFYRVIPKQ